MGDTIAFQQMGFGVAVALLIDATIVRSVLVPATMKLLGERNWYLPAWLDLASRRTRRGRRAAAGERASADARWEPAEMTTTRSEESLNEARRHVRRKRIFYTVLAIWIALSLMWLLDRSAR